MIRVTLHGSVSSAWSVVVPVSFGQDNFLELCFGSY